MARCRCRAKSFGDDQDGPPHVEGRGPPYLLASVYIQKCLPRNGMAMRSRIEDERIVVGTKRATFTSGLLSCSILRSTEYQPSAPLPNKEHANMSACASRCKRDTCFGQWPGPGAIDWSHAVVSEDQLPRSQPLGYGAARPGGARSTKLSEKVSPFGFRRASSSKEGQSRKRTRMIRQDPRNPVDRPLLTRCMLLGRRRILSNRSRFGPSPLDPAVSPC
jgi:hypothetical protein